MIDKVMYLDACLPDYFQGFSGVVLAVPCYAGMTYQNLRDGIEDDSNAGDYGLEDWTGFESALAAAFDGVDMSARVDFVDHSTADSEDDAGESVYAYFGIVETSAAQ